MYNVGDFVYVTIHNLRSSLFKKKSNIIFIGQIKSITDGDFIIHSRTLGKYVAAKFSGTQPIIKLLTTEKTNEVIKNVTLNKVITDDIMNNFEPDISKSLFAKYLDDIQKYIDNRLDIGTWYNVKYKSNEHKKEFYIKSENTGVEFEKECFEKYNI